MTRSTTDDRGEGGGNATADLRGAGQELVDALLHRVAGAASDRITGLTDRLTDVTESGEGLRSALRGPRRDDKDSDDDGDDDGGGGGGGGPGSAIKSGLASLKDGVKNIFGGQSGGQGGKKPKVTNIVESGDVGVPLRTAYDLWTQFTTYPQYMKKVESVQQASEEKTQWRAKVFWSHREWEATIVEQVPDSHIVWQSKGAKGRVDGAVTFTELGPNLTRVVLVLEYFPQGLFEKTGNIWRAQGRRARLEFKHFIRHAMTQGLLHPEEVEGWRGEIRDGEVVRTHEEALEDEGEESAEDTEGGEDTEDDRDYDDEDYDEQDTDEDFEENGEDESEDVGNEPVDEDEGYEDESDEDEGDEEDYGEQDYGEDESDDEDYDDEDYRDEDYDEEGYDDEEDDEGETESRPARRRERVGASAGRNGRHS